MPAEGRENPLLKKGNSDAFFREKYLTKNRCTVSEKVVRRIMREERLTVLCKRRRKYNSYQGEISPSVPNKIERDFHADKPNQKWLTDITEFALPAGKVYLSVLVDCFDGLLPSWTISTTPDSVLVNTMLDQAIAHLPERERPVIHSDRGCHYLKCYNKVVTEVANKI